MILPQTPGIATGNTEARLEIHDDFRINQQSSSALKYREVLFLCSFVQVIFI